LALGEKVLARPNLINVRAPNYAILTAELLPDFSRRRSSLALAGKVHVGKSGQH
jgi:hypothetical protein